MRRPRVAVIPVAGLGTRFLPVTKAVPKELLPVLDRPSIEHIVAEVVLAGMDRVVFVTRPCKASLQAYFERAPALEAVLEASGRADLCREVRRIGSMARVEAVYQPEARGLGHAVSCAREAVAGEAFAVLLGDHLVDAEVSALEQVICARSAPEQAVVALTRVPEAKLPLFGVCAGEWLDPGRLAVRDMVERPAPGQAPSDLGIVGRYLLPPEIFDLLARTAPGRGGEIQLTDAIRALVPAGRVLGALLQGTLFDTGEPLGLLRASLHYACKRPDLASEARALAAEYAKP